MATLKGDRSEVSRWRLLRGTHQSVKLGLRAILKKCVTKAQLGWSVGR